MSLGTMERKETVESRKVRLAKEAAEKLKIQNIEQSLTPEVLSVVKSSGIFPTFVGRIRTHHLDRCKDFCLLGFGKKDPRIVVIQKDNDFSLVQIHI